MTKYVFNIEQINQYELVIEAESEAEAIEFFDSDYLVEDFGEPVNSRIEWEIFD